MSARCLRWRKLIDSGDAGTAAEEIRVEAEKGDGEALMMMGIILESCNLPEPAVEHFKRGAEAGCATSMFMYARRIMATNGHDLSTPEGKVVREGDGLEVLTALTWLKKAADGLVSDDDGTEVMLEGCEEALCFALFYQACILQDCPGLLEDSVIEQDEALTCLNKILDIVPSCSYRKQIDLQIKARLRSAVDSSPKGADENPLATKSAHTACDDHVEADVVECTAEEEKSATATPAPEEAPVQPAPPSGRCLRWRKLIDSGDAGTAAEEIRVEAEKGDGEALMMMGIILESCNLPEPAVEHFKRGAEAGCATSMFMYARRIMTTNGHDLSTPEGKVVREGDGLEVLTALTWLKKAADGLVSDEGTEVMLEGCEEALCFALFYQACILQDCPGLLEDSVIEQDEALTCLNKILDIVPSCSYRKQIDLQIKARIRSAVDSSPKGADENPLATEWRQKFAEEDKPAPPPPRAAQPQPPAPVPIWTNIPAPAVAAKTESFVEELPDDTLVQTVLPPQPTPTRAAQPVARPVVLSTPTPASPLHSATQNDMVSKLTALVSAQADSIERLTNSVAAQQQEIRVLQQEVLNLKNRDTEEVCVTESKELVFNRHLLSPKSLLSADLTTFICKKGTPACLAVGTRVLTPENTMTWQVKISSDSSSCWSAILGVIPRSHPTPYTVRIGKDVDTYGVDTSKKLVGGGYGQKTHPTSWASAWMKSQTVVAVSWDGPNGTLFFKRIQPDERGSQADFGFHSLTLAADKEWLAGVWIDPTFCDVSAAIKQ